ncbi:MAG TPA: heme o synthase [Thermohalobaculum sp.]|nr:heme o synthase [Thermohalobaculum sp.]
MSTAQIGEIARSSEPEFRDYVSLLKPRVMSLVVFTALAGMVAAPVPVHPAVALASLICIAVGAGASGALNMWWDADIDARMSRTRDRAIPSGLIEPGEALGLGLGLSLISVMMLSVVANPLAAGILAFTIFFYAVVYTMWLKRSTPQNIVIGGAAGAFPPMIAWAAATGEISTASVLMFAVIFVWTPPHFWALALFRNDDYARVGVPMMPAVAGEASTRRQIWLYSLLLAPVALAPAFTVAGGPVYLAVALGANIGFLRGAWRVSRRTQAMAASDGYRAEKKLFGVSILYLFALFGAFILDAILAAVTGPVPWPVWL